MVSRSVEQHDSFSYLLARALRILPALGLSLVVSAFIIGPIFTRLSLYDYLRQPGVWHYVLGLFVFNIETVVPSVFMDLHSPQMNGSLWTLPVECAFYLVLPLLSMVGLLKQGWVLIIVALNCLFLFYCSFALSLTWENEGGYIFAQVPLFSGVKTCLFFVIGSAIWAHRREIILGRGIAICCAILLTISSQGAARSIVLYICLPYLTMYVGLGTRRRFHLSRKIGDLSYGAYLFAFPVQQAVIASFGGKIGPYRLTAIAVPLVLILSAISWWGIERPFLALRAYLDQRDATVG